MSKRPHVSKPQSAPSSSKKERTHTKGANTGPIAFFIALFVIAVGSIQIISAFHTYAINLSELPWYSELAYSFKESDARKPDAANNGNTAESRQQNDPDATAGTDAPQDGGSAGQ